MKFSKDEIKKSMEVYQALYKMAENYCKLFDRKTVSYFNINYSYNTFSFLPKEIDGVAFIDYDATVTFSNDILLMNDKEVEELFVKTLEEKKRTRTKG